MRWLSPLMVVVGTLAVGCGLSYAADADLVDAEALAPTGLVKYWQCNIPVQDGAAVVNIYIEDENLYLLSDQGTVYVVDADVGLVRWSAPIAEPPFHVFRPCHSLTKEAPEELRTVIASTTHVMAFHRRSGRLLAKGSLDFTPSGPPLIGDQEIYIGSVNNRYFALRSVSEGLQVLEPKKKGLMWYAIIVLNDGKRLYHEAENLTKARAWQQEWLDRLGGPQKEQKATIRRWQIDTGGNVKARPAVVDGVAYIPTDDGQIIAIKTKDKIKKWSVRVSGEILTDPIIGQGMIYFATTARSVYAVDRVNGSRQWQCYLPVALKRTGYLTRRTLYQPGEPAGVYAINPADGKLRWVFEQAGDFLAEQGDTAYLFKPGQAVFQVEIETGKLIRKIACPDAVLSVGNTRDTTIYIAGSGGRLMCIRPKDVPYLRRAQFQQAMRGIPASQPEGETAKGATTAKKADEPAGENVEQATPKLRGAGDPLRSHSELRPAVNPNPE